MKKWIIGIVFFFVLSVIILFFVGGFELLLECLIAILPLIFIGLLIAIGSLFYYVGKSIGGNKARKEINRELKKLNIDNPYIYFRDIPNKYGIGVSLSILNLKIGKKDVLAAILDLCAKGYIKFKQVDKKYEIIETDKEKSLLMGNEIYILDWIKTQKKFNLKQWANLNKEDAINLGLGVEAEGKKYKTIFNMDTPYAKSLMLTSYIFSFILGMFYHIYMNEQIIIAIIYSLFMALFLTFPVFVVVFIIMLFIALLYDGVILSYNSKKKNMLTLTEMGKNEYHELCSLGKFLDDFGRFAEKHVDEIVIWEQYLSYAILFGLGKKILNTGYDKLKINDSFIIDDLDKIVL